MTEDWPARFTREALAKVDAFIAEHPEYTREGVAQPGQGATNRVFFARRGEHLVVLKVFCETERKERECFGLRHWQDTGLVPDLIWDEDPVLVVMSHVPGMYLQQARAEEGQVRWQQACRDTGRAIGALTRVPLRAADRAAFESRFYLHSELPTLEAYLGRILTLGRSLQARDPDFSDGVWKRNLDFIERQLAGLLAQPRLLYHQDVGNLHVQGGRFMGFFDLEMCRVGCAGMQLGTALGLLRGAEEGWPLFREGWEAAVGHSLAPEERAAAAAAGFLLDWREITRYLSYDGTPGTGYAWAEPADPARYRTSADSVLSMLAIELA